jgi:CubicO group peptidase (beta-lactamase class C family)
MVCHNLLENFKGQFMKLANLFRNSLRLIILSLFTLQLCFAQQGVKRGEVRSPQSAQDILPKDSGAGKQFAAWLDAFNSGRRDALQQFIAANFEPPPNAALPVERMTNRQFELYKNTGGFLVRKVTADSSAPEKISVVLESKRTGFFMTIGMATQKNSPEKILGMGFRGSEAPPELLPKAKLTDEQLRRNIDNLIGDLIKANQFSGVILVARNGKPVYQRASGLANKVWNIPNQLDTKFNVASISKMFTAVAVAQLAEQGKLSFDDPVGKWLPEYPNKDIAQKITVHHLLSHTSGLKETNTTDSSFRRGFRTIKDYLPTAPGDTLKFEPGTKLEYSNYGYLLLGAIIEKVSGEDFYTYIREHICKPAGMMNTDSFELDTEPANLATGYMDAPNNTRRSNAFMLPVKGLPSGLGYSTVEDLVKFNLALTGGKLLNKKSLETVWLGRMNYNEPDSQYGYGFIVKRYNGTRVIGHGGGWVGITNKFDMYPDLGYTVVILNNIDSDPNSIAFKLREWLTQGQIANQ